MSKYLIVGIDPGTTTAFCALDLNGKLVAIESSKKINGEKLLKRIFEIGEPIIFSCDVNPCPSFIQEITSKIRVKIIIPEENLRIFQKHEIVKESKIGAFKNIHERDALASAFFAFKYYQPLFEKIEKMMTNESKEKIDRVKRRIVFGEAKSIKHAIEMEKEEKEEIGVVEKLVHVKIPKYDDFVLKLKKDNENLKELVEKLKQENIYLRDEISRIERKSVDKDIPVKIIEKEKTIGILSAELKKLRERIDNLEFFLNELKNRNQIKKEGKIVVLEVELLDNDKMNEIKEWLDQDTIIYAKEIELSKDLIKEIPNKMIISERKHEIEDLTIIDPNEIEIKEKNGVKFVEKNEILDKTIGEIISKYRSERSK